MPVLTSLLLTASDLPYSLSAWGSLITSLLLSILFTQQPDQLSKILISSITTNLKILPWLTSILVTHQEPVIPASTRTSLSLLNSESQLYWTSFRCSSSLCSFSPKNLSMFFPLVLVLLTMSSYLLVSSEISFRHLPQEWLNNGAKLKCLFCIFALFKRFHNKN